MSNNDLVVAQDDTDWQLLRNQEDFTKLSNCVDHFENPRSYPVYATKVYNRDEGTQLILLTMEDLRQMLTFADGDMSGGSE